MNDKERLQRLEITVQIQQRDIAALMQRGTELEVELAMKRVEIDRLTDGKPTRKAAK